MIGPHPVTFTGTISFALLHPDGAPPRFTMIDQQSRARLDAIDEPIGRDDGVVLQERPDRSTVSELVAQAKASGARSIVAIGDGALIDAAKQVAQGIRDQSGETIPMTLVPCGPEAYRAFTPFSVVDDEGRRERPTVRDRAFAAAEVVLWSRLLEQLEAPLVARNALDSAVHALESMLSTRATPLSQELSLAALRIVAQNFDLAVAGGSAGRTEARVRLLIGTHLTVEAFGPTMLGIAHAVASPLGTAQGITHDAINGVLGPVMVRFWSNSAGLDAAAKALGAGPGRPDEVVACVLERYRSAAALPPSLRELGIRWETVAGILPRAGKSAGIPNLPSAVGAAGLERFARAGWAGQIEGAP